MITTYLNETWEEYYNDPAREGLWWEHYNELGPAHEGKMEMAPDLATYQNLQNSGALQITVARQEGRMVGYCLIFIRPHIHYCKSLVAYEDSYFLTAGARKGLVGYKLIKKSLQGLKARGVVKAFFMTKEFLSVAVLFRRLGMKKMDEVWCLWLGDE